MKVLCTASDDCNREGGHSGQPGDITGAALDAWVVLDGARVPAVNAETRKEG